MLGRGTWTPWVLLPVAAACYVLVVNGSRPSHPRWHVKVIPVPLNGSHIEGLGHDALVWEVGFWNTCLTHVVYFGNKMQADNSVVQDKKCVNTEELLRRFADGEP